MVDDALLWAFTFLYHRDRMNAAVHCAPARWSEVTVRCAMALFNQAEPDGSDITAEVADVLRGM